MHDCTPCTASADHLSRWFDAEEHARQIVIAAVAEEGVRLGGIAAALDRQGLDSACHAMLDQSDVTFAASTILDSLKPAQKLDRFPRHADVLAALERIGHPRSARAVAGWSTGEKAMSIEIAFLLGVELGLDLVAWFALLVGLRKARREGGS